MFIIKSDFGPRVRYNCQLQYIQIVENMSLPWLRSSSNLMLVHIVVMVHPDPRGIHTYVTFFRLEIINKIKLNSNRGPNESFNCCFTNQLVFYNIHPLNAEKKNWN